MKAIVTTADERLVELRDVPEPQLESGEIIVAVQAFSLNRGELTLLRTRPEGWRPGQDIAGVVAAVAPGVNEFAVGQRVVGWTEQRGWAERAAVKISRAARIPDGVPVEEASTLPIAALTALRVIRIGGMVFGKRVLVTGADGGVGHFAVQIAARAGAIVTAIAKPQHAQAMREYGADTVVDRIEEAPHVYDLVLESVGGRSLEAAIQKVSPGGTIVCFGNSSNADATINFFQFFGHENARIVTSFSYADPDDGSAAADLRALLRSIERGELTPRIALRRTWRELADGAGLLAQRALFGKAVFRVE